MLWVKVWGNKALNKKNLMSLIEKGIHIWQLIIWGWTQFIIINQQWQVENLAEVLQWVQAINKID